MPGLPKGERIMAALKLFPSKFYSYFFIFFYLLLSFLFNVLVYFPRASSNKTIEKIYTNMFVLFYQHVMISK